MGELLRRFWLSVLLSEELLEPDGPPKKIVVMGEPLLGFRDTRGRVGIWSALATQAATSAGRPRRWQIEVTGRAQFRHDGP